MAGLQDFHQGSQCHGKTWIGVLLGVIQLLIPFVQRGGAQLQALSQISTSVVEVWQPEEADPFVPLQGEKERRRDGVPLEESSSPYTQERGKPLHFQPPLLEFGTQPLGLPRAETIYINNPSQEVSVTLLSMFTSSKHFYIPSFHKSVIPPRGKASFKLIFLPSKEGNIENTLFINTSAHGLLSYQVFGVGGHRGSLKSFQRKDNLVIFPHIQSIKLTQTQEDASNITILGLHLECSLTKSFQNNPQGSCLHKEERLSMQINLSARGDRPADLDKLKPYVIEHILFMFVAPSALEGNAKVGVYMLNSGGKKLYIKDMQVLSKVEINLDINQVLLIPEAKNFTEVAAFSCKGSLSGHGEKCINHISLKIMLNRTTYNFPGVHITHRWRVADLFSLFQAKQKNVNEVDVWFTNPLHVPLTVLNASLSEKLQGLVKVMNFSRPLRVPSGCWHILSLQLLSRAVPINQMLTLSLDTSLGTTLHIPLYFHSTSSKGEVVFEAEGECGHHCPLRLSEKGHSEWQRSLLPDFFSSSWAVDSKLASELCSQWQSRENKPSCRWPRLTVEPSSTLDFGATAVNESKVKGLTLKNPSSSVVSVEIRILSLYPSPLEALDLLNKWFEINPLNVNISTSEFLLLSSPPKMSENEGTLDIRAEGVLRLLLQPWEVREVSVVFTPSEHKPTTTILVIRNNLTVFDMVTVKGHGAKELLRVGGKLPGPAASLRFNVPQSTLMDCRDGLRSSSKPLFAIRKSFKVENAGELPLTVISMNINGYKCQGFGFEVLQCRSFSLEQNTSSEITIAFTPDFTSSWVIRDLTLVTSRGTFFPFTLNVTLPHHMLPLCAQVVPGPSWEETFWVVTLIFTCFSLFGVCLMAFYQAQYILTEFSTPSLRSNHTSALSRDNGSVNNVTPNGVNKTKGSCKTYVDTCHTSDKGKGRGSPVLANTPALRPQSSKKSSSASPSQQQKKHKVSLYYSKYKSSPSTAAAVSVDEEHEELTPESPLTPDPCNNNPAFIDELDNKADDLQSSMEEMVSAAGMFPMEIPAEFPTDATLDPGSRPVLLFYSPLDRSCTEHYAQKIDSEKRDNSEPEAIEESKGQKKKGQGTEMFPTTGNKSKKSRRKTENASSAPELNGLLTSERDKETEWKTGDHSVSGTRSRNRCSFKAEDLKPGLNSENFHKQNGVCPARTHRKCQAQRRADGVCESGSDSGSSSGSSRTSRGSWGSWSSASSIEGDKEHSARGQTCSTSSRKRDSMQYSNYSQERDYQTVNANYKTLSMNSLYHNDACQSPETPAPSFMPSFAAVAAGMDKNMELSGQYPPGEPFSALSIPLTNEFRYNTTEALPYIAQPAASGSYNGFTWSSANRNGNNPPNYTDNGGFSGCFPHQESRDIRGNQPSWNEEQPRKPPTTWNSAACVGSKPFFPATRSLSPMSSLFGSIWTPQSEPYQRHFQPDRSGPISPVFPATPITPPHSPFSRGPGAPYGPIQYSGFNPFGPHMNLDIWNSSSNRSSNSQLSNDSGYCGDV